MYHYLHGLIYDSYIILDSPLLKIFKKKSIYLAIRLKKVCKSDIPTYTAKNVLIILSVNFENSSLYITVQNYLKFGYLCMAPAKML